MSVALPFTICVATLLTGVFIGRWFRVGMIALTTLGLVLATAGTCQASGLPTWECALSAIGLSFVLQSGYLLGAVMDLLASEGTDCARASLGPT